MHDEGITDDRITLRRLADLRYTGQAFELTIPVDPAGAVDIAAMEAAFHAEHVRTYGHSSPGDPVDLINIRVVASSAPESKVGLAEQLKDAQAEGAGRGTRPVYFSGRLVQTPVVSRGMLATLTHGPCIVEEFDATCIVPPGASAQLDQHGNIVIDAGEP